MRKEVSNRKFFVRCGYGLDLRYTGFSTTVHAQPHRRKQLVQRITAPHRTVRFLKNTICIYFIYYFEVLFLILRRMGKNKA